MENIYADVEAQHRDEQCLDLLTVPNLRIERIVSTGQATPPGEWLDQDRAEWVIVLRGAAELRFEGDDQPRILKPGDYLNIPAHCRHRVAWTAAEEPTIWLAVHYAAPSEILIVGP